MWRLGADGHLGQHRPQRGEQRRNPHFALINVLQQHLSPGWGWGAASRAQGRSQANVGRPQTPQHPRPGHQRLEEPCGCLGTGFPACLAWVCSDKVIRDHRAQADLVTSLHTCGAW
ncbi:hypothetical protein Q9966_003692 [Columba livia]|nr:hypothetical protein Q9966_003692 [Columba livia]